MTSIATAGRRSGRGLAAAVLLLAALAAPQPASAAPSAADRVLRVYNNNIENLIRNNADGTCTRITGPDHLTSMLVDDAGKTGTAGVLPPDILIVQQIRGTGQATAYADQLSAKFGLAAGTYRAIVAWDDPEPWGSTHHCTQQDLGDLKAKQTNALIYNSQRLSLAAGDISKYWSAGWLKPGTAYANGAGCTLYKPPNADAGTTNQYKWKRTSAIAARFTIRDTGTTVFAATMHLPEENRQNACAGDGDKGVGSTGIHLGVDATSLLNASTIRVVGIDANRTGIPASTLAGYGMTGYGTAATDGSSKIDYIFVQGAVQPSSVGYTVAGTKSNHKALYAFVGY
ncbi:MAG TPA: hypothetical protein VK659_10160 [Asanoa sp.]|nr:hypothetical protein [Asanoa sp.]